MHAGAVKARVRCHHCQTPARLGDDELSDLSRRLEREFVCRYCKRAFTVSLVRGRPAPVPPPSSPRPPEPPDAPDPPKLDAAGPQKALPPWPSLVPKDERRPAAAPPDLGTLPPWGRIDPAAAAERKSLAAWWRAQPTGKRRLYVVAAVVTLGFAAMVAFEADAPPPPAAVAK